MMLAFMFMGGYYYFSAPRYNIQSESREELIKTAPIKTLINCLTTNHQKAVDDNEINFQPHGYEYKTKNLCEQRYQIKSIKLCSINGKISSNCYPSKEDSSQNITHYVISKSSFLRNKDTAKLLNILKQDFSHNVNLGIVINQNNKPTLIASNEINIEIPEIVIANADLKNGDIINFTELSNEDILSAIRNQTRPRCLGSKISVYRFGGWECIDATASDVCFGDTIFDSIQDTCVLNEDKKPTCKSGYIADFNSEINSWQCIIDEKSIPECDEGFRPSFDFSSLTWKCVYDSVNTKNLTKCESFDSSTSSTTEKPSIITQTITSSKLGCSACEITVSTDCNDEKKSFCIPDSTKAQSCNTNSICDISTGKQTYVFNYPPKNGTKKQQSYWTNIINKGLGDILPSDDNYISKNPYNMFSCLDCSPLFVDKANFPYYAECKTSGTQKELCGQDKVLVSDTNSKSGYSCQKIDEINKEKHIVPPCPVGYKRDSSILDMKCIPNWCSNTGMSSNDVFCPAEKSIMVYKDSKYTNSENEATDCVYCWRPPYALPAFTGLNDMGNLQIQGSDYSRFYDQDNNVKNITPIFSTELLSTPSLESNNGVMPLVPTITSAYSGISIFGSRDYDNENAFDDNSYQGVYLRFKYSDNENNSYSPLPIPIPQSILKNVYQIYNPTTEQQEPFIPCPTINSTTGNCYDFITLNESGIEDGYPTFAIPANIRNWETNSWIDSWWGESFLMTTINTGSESFDIFDTPSSNFQNSVASLDSGIFTNSGDLKVKLNYRKPIPWSIGINSYRIEDLNKTVIFEPENEINFTEVSDLFPYYGCGSTYSDTNGIHETPCTVNEGIDYICFDVLVSNGSNLRELTSDEKIQYYFNPAKYLIDTNDINTSNYNYEKSTSGAYNILTNGNKSIYTYSLECANTSDSEPISSTVGCPPYMIRIWENAPIDSEEKGHWSTCFYNMCETGIQESKSIFENLRIGKKQGYIYYKNTNDLCVNKIKPTLSNQTLSFWQRLGSAYERLVDLEGIDSEDIIDNSESIFYQRGENCPYGSYYYWNDDAGWIGCVYNFMLETDIITSESLWGNYNPALLGSNKRVSSESNQENASGSIWDPTAETFTEYRNRRGLNESYDNKIIMLTENFSINSTDISLPALYLWNAPAWVSIEDAKSTTDTSNDYFFSVSDGSSTAPANIQITDNSNFIDYLPKDENNNLLGTFNKTGTTLSIFETEAMNVQNNYNLTNPDDSNNQIIYSLDDIKNLIIPFQNHIMAPEYVKATAQKIQNTANNHNNSALFGNNRLFYTDLANYTDSNNLDLSNKLDNYYTTEELDNEPITDYGCFAGKYLTYDSSIYKWGSNCNKYLYCDNSGFSTQTMEDKTGYLSLIKKRNSNYCIDLVISEPDIDNSSASFTIDNTGNFNQFYGANNSSTGDTLSSLSNIADNNEFLTTNIINCNNNYARNTTEYNQCNYERIRASDFVELYNNTPGVYRFLLRSDATNTTNEINAYWSEPIINWCDDNYAQDIANENLKGYIATYFVGSGELNPFENNNWQTYSTGNIKNIDLSNRELFNTYENRYSSLPCLHLWKPNTTNTSTYTDCLNGNTDWIKLKCIFNKALGITDNTISTLESANYTCDSNSCNFDANNVKIAYLPFSSSDPLFSNLFNTNTDTTATISNPLFIHRFNDKTDKSWNPNADPVFCNELITLANDTTATRQIKATNPAINTKLEGTIRLSNNQCIMTTANRSAITGANNISNLCWDFSDLYDNKTHNFIYFAKDSINNCITVGYSDLELSSYETAKIVSGQTLFPSNEEPIALPICGQQNLVCNLNNL